MESLKKAIFKIVGWLLVALAYTYLIDTVITLPSWLSFIDLNAYKDSVTIHLVGKDWTLFQLSWFVWAYCIYKMINGVFDGLFPAIIDLIVILSFFFLFYPNITFSATLSISLLQLTLSFSWLMMWLCFVAAYSLSLAIEVLKHMYERLHPECYRTGFVRYEDKADKKQVQHAQAIAESKKAQAAQKTAMVQDQELRIKKMQLFETEYQKLCTKDSMFYSANQCSELTKKSCKDPDLNINGNKLCQQYYADQLKIEKEVVPLLQEMKPVKTKK